MLTASSDLAAFQLHWETRGLHLRCGCDARAARRGVLLTLVARQARESVSGLSWRDGSATESGACRPLRWCVRRLRCAATAPARSTPPPGRPTTMTPRSTMSPTRTGGSTQYRARPAVDPTKGPVVPVGRGRDRPGKGTVTDLSRTLQEGVRGSYMPDAAGSDLRLRGIPGANLVGNPGIPGGLRGQKFPKHQ